MKNRDKPTDGKYRVCSQCQVEETECLQVITIVLPPTIPKRTDVCRNCLSVLIDNSILKNHAKYREENAT
jgi:hypothetical protein